MCLEQCPTALKQVISKLLLYNINPRVLPLPPSWQPTSCHTIPLSIADGLAICHQTVADHVAVVLHALQQEVQMPLFRPSDDETKRQSTVTSLRWHTVVTGLQTYKKKGKASKSRQTDAVSTHRGATRGWQPHDSRFETDKWGGMRGDC